MLTKEYYEMRRTSLYKDLCRYTTLRQELNIRKEIEALEKEWTDQNKCIQYLEKEAKHVKRQDAIMPGRTKVTNKKRKKSK